MASYDNNKSTLRYTIFAVLLTMVAVAVLAKGFYIMTVQRAYWSAVDSLVKRDSIPMKPMRAHIWKRPFCRRARPTRCGTTL